MTDSPFQGVMPALTTPFRDDLSIDHDFLAQHVSWLVENGARGLIPLGSLGEGATLGFEEKQAILRTCVAAAGDAPVTPGISALSTAEAVRLAREAEAVGCRGLMALPAYVHNGKWHETRAHFGAVFAATTLPCMLYNNPIAYGVDVAPSQVASLAERHPNLVAVKESSGDVRRVTGIRAATADRISVLVGLDDMIVEGLAAGASGWVAGLVNALPAESVRLFELASTGARDEALRLYRWFLPLLRLDTVPEFVQLIKLVQAEVGMGSENVRPPRLRLLPEERETALGTIRAALAKRPPL